MERFLRAVAAEFSSHDLDAARDVANRLAAVAGHCLCPGQDGAGVTHGHLETALSAPQAHPLVAHLERVSRDLGWAQGSGFTMPAGFRGRYAFCEIAGRDGTITTQGFRFGAYLQFPDTWYPVHSHAAEELYFILGGTARWTRDGVDGQLEPAGTLIRHAPHEGHATGTLEQPLLALWAWLGNIEFSSYRIERV